LGMANAPRGSRSGGKGASGGKSTKKRKQDFHRHRQQPQATAAPTPEELRNRVVIALDKLGHQRLSTEPGGYDLQSWTRNVNMLLDDFQERIQPTTLPDDYYKKRMELVDGRFGPKSASSYDSQVEEIRRGMTEARRKLIVESERLTAKLTTNESARIEMAKELEEVRRELEDAAERKKNGSVLSRFFGREVRPPKETEDKERELASKLDSLIAERVSLKAELAALENPSVGSLAEELNTIQTKLAEAEAERERRMQLSQERELVLSEIARIVSGIALAEQNTKDRA